MIKVRFLSVVWAPCADSLLVFDLSDFELIHPCYFRLYLEVGVVHLRGRRQSNTGEEVWSVEVVVNIESRSLVVVNDQIFGEWLDRGNIVASVPESGMLPTRQD